MGQELPQPLSPHAPELFPFSSQPPHPSSLMYDKTTNNMDDMDDVDMAEDQYGLTASPQERSSTTDLPSETVDTTDYSTVDNVTEQNTSDDTNPLSETFEQPQLKPFYKRELRPMREPKRCLPNTWVDADMTGDFDPHEEARQARERRKKAKLSQRKKFDWNTGDNTNVSDINRRPAAKARPILCITFGTSSGRAAFSELDAKSEQKAEQAYAVSLAGYSLRKRGGTDDGRDIVGADATSVRVKATDLDLKNQPAGRGCWNCLAGAQRCSLLDNEHSWPCDECEESEDDCQLIQEPDLKLACTHCQYIGKRQKWLVCSFEYSQNPAYHRGRCEQCRKDGHKNCVAGPWPGVTRTRLRIGPDGAPYRTQVSATQSRHQVKTCRQCLDSRRVCSFASRSQHGGEDICTACDMSGAACQPLGWKKSGIQKYQQSKINASASSALGGLNTLNDLDVDDSFFDILSNPPQTPISAASSCGSDFSPKPLAHSTGDTGGTVKTVRTKFRHPMLFDYQDKTEDGSDPCHFCSSAYFGLIGLEERTTNVIEWYDGRGWEEIDGGHRGDSIKGSKMCTYCTMTRMQIMICDDHALRRIAELGVEVNYEAAFGRLFDPELAGGDRWCSVCCNLAAYECCVGQDVQPGGGCGLALCEACVGDLELCGGSLETMLQTLEDGPSEARPTGLRADYELLREDGLLIRYLKHAAET